MGRISEIFYSVQGEQPGLGEPAVFVRFAGCNLKCSFCDSKYSWEKGTAMSVPQVFSEIQKYGTCSRNVVITGGEPTIQKSFLMSLIYKLRQNNYTVSLETNGTHFDWRFVMLNHIAVSPKLINDITIDSCIQFIRLPNAYFKIVFVNEQYVRNMLCTLSHIPKDRVYIMTEAADRKTLRKKLKQTYDFCLKTGYNMGYRLQIEMFDKKRGV